MQKKTCLFGKNLWEKLLLAVVVIYAVFLAGITVQTGSKFIGEAASYTLTTVSLVNDGNAIISQDDIAKAKEFFPEWAERYDEFKGSSYTTEQGVVPWYFATYPAACIPAFVILKLAGAPLESAFCLTNLACFLLALAAAALEPRLRGGQRALLCLVLGIHPAIFYLSWPSAEVFQFACIAVASIWWAAGRKHPAALLIAIGGNDQSLHFGHRSCHDRGISCIHMENHCRAAQTKGCAVYWAMEADHSLWMLLSAGTGAVCL